MTKKNNFLNFAIKYPFFYKLYLFYNIFIRHRKFLFRSTLSQLGEDKIINKIIKKKEDFYVDIGCNHPIKNNNTFLLYKKGLSGLNIDISKINIDLFKFIRSRDININEAISDKNQKTKVYIPNNNWLSYEITINKNFRNTLIKKHKNKYSSKNVFSLKWSSILKKYNIKIKKIDFLKIDVEGMDYKILRSIDIAKYRTKLIMIETPDFDKINSKKIEKYLFKKKYKKIYQNELNSIFQKK